MDFRCVVFPLFSRRFVLGELILFVLADFQRNLMHWAHKFSQGALHGIPKKRVAPSLRALWRFKDAVDVAVASSRFFCCTVLGSRVILFVLLGALLALMLAGCTN